jgi:putative FmdB family regulatory protein
MPIYEYRCLACKRRTSVLLRSVSSPVRAACEHCGSARLSRLMSKFAVHGGGIDLDNPSGMEGIDESDPRAMARFMRQMGEESGEAMEPEFEEMIGRMEAGESPESLMGGSALDDDFSGGDDDF